MCTNFRPFCKNIEVLIGWKASNETRRSKKTGKGIFGTPLAMFGVVEAQARGCLHYHGLVFCDFAAEILTKYAHNDEWRKKICDIIDSRFRAIVDDEVDPVENSDDEANDFFTDAPVEEKENKEERNPYPEQEGKEIGLRETPKHASEILPFSNNVCKQKNYHRHTFSCAKNKKKTFRCGVDRPFCPKTDIVQIEENEDGEIIEKNIEHPPKVDPDYPFEPRDLRILALNLLRPSKKAQKQIEANPLLSAFMKCNSCVSFCGSVTQAKAAIWYIPKYLSKSPCDLAHTIPILNAAFNATKKYPSVAEDSGEPQRNAKYLLSKIINKMTGMCEYSQEQVAMALLGMNSYYSIQELWTCWIGDAIKFQERENKVDILEKFDENHDSEIEDSDSENEECVDDFENYVGVHDIVEMDENKNILTTKQHLNYRFRGEQLADLNFYEYAACIKMVPKKDEDETK